MNAHKLVFIFPIMLLPVLSFAGDEFESDVITTSPDYLKITFIGHGTLMFHFNDMAIHVDPVGRYADYSKMPKADVILITHEHGDHLDPEAVKKIRKPDTKIVLTEKCSEKFPGGVVMKNGDAKNVKGIAVKAVPAYNIVHKRANGAAFHPKGVGNGYVIRFGETTVYVAGDTENIPEMKELSGIDIAFLPMNLPYTMTPAMVADAVRMFNPRVLYPYHYGDTDPEKIVRLLKDKKDCEVRIRDLR